MKNFLKTNYNLYPSKIYKNNNYYFFFSGNSKILIIKSNKTSKELDRYVKISNELYNSKVDISTFLLNVNGEYYTKKDNTYIILLKYNSNNDSISFVEISKFINIYNNNLNELNIINQWENTIDNIEKEMTEYKNEFPIIQQSLNYFIGISENAIQLLKSIKNYNNSVGHNLSLNNFNNYEIHNPINLVRTNKMHDISLYVKYKFYYDYIDYEELYDIIKKENKKDLIYFYSSMLYQSEYFDDVKDVLLTKKDEKILLKYIDNKKKYIDLLKYIKDTLHNIKEIAEIEWIDE